MANMQGQNVTEYKIPADGDTPPFANALPGAMLADPTGLLVQTPPTVIAPGPLTGMAGSRFAVTLTAGRGFGPYNWSLASGALPSGLTLSSAGTISGTPTATGTTTFTVKATDQSLPTPLSATASVSITIKPAVQPAVYVANGGSGTLTSYAPGNFGNVSPLSAFGRLGFGLSAPAGLTIAPTQIELDAPSVRVFAGFVAP